MLINVEGNSQTPLIPGSSLLFLGSHRVSIDITGRENRNVFADFIHSSRFS